MLIRLAKCLDASVVIKKETGAEINLLYRVLVKSYCFLFPSDPFEDGNILNDNNLTHTAGPALCTAILLPIGLYTLFVSAYICV